MLRDSDQASEILKAGISAATSITCHIPGNGEKQIGVPRIPGTCTEREMQWQGHGQITQVTSLTQADKKRGHPRGGALGGPRKTPQPSA